MRKSIKCLVLFLALIVHAFVYANSYRVTAERLNVREKASSKSSIVFKLSKGDVVEGKPSGKWVEITCDGKNGYVFSKYVEEVTYKPSDTVQHKSYTLPTGPLLYWFLGIIITYIIGKVIYSDFSFKDLFEIVIAAVVIPLLAKFIFGLFGVPTIGYILGWVLVVFSSIANILSKREESEKKKQPIILNNVPTNGFNNSSGSVSVPHVANEDYDMDIDDYGNETDDHNNDIDDFDNDIDDYEERKRKYEEEKEMRESEKVENERMENNRKAEEYRSEYEYYSKKAREASDQARTYRDRAEDCYRMAQDYDDETYYREAESNDADAEIWEEKAEELQAKANEAEEKLNEYRDMAY